MKVCDKRKLYMMRSVESVKIEMDILSTIIHPLVLNMNYAFHDQKNAYMVSEYLKGGDLRYYLNKDSLVFTEK
jgi:serine/threonine protein kinase